MLKKLWAQGKSARQIAALLGGVTAKAVFARVRRLGLPGRTATAGSVSDVPEPVREYLRAFQSGEVSTLKQWVAADVDHLQIGDDGDATTEKAMISGLGLDGVLAVIEGMHELLRDFKIEVYEAEPWPGEPDVWSVKFMLSGVWQQSIPQGLQAGQHVRLPGHIHGEGRGREDRAVEGAYLKMTAHRWCGRRLLMEGSGNACLGTRAPVRRLPRVRTWREQAPGR
jgi:GcrA cell cycle regulator